MNTCSRCASFLRSDGACPTCRRGAGLGAVALLGLVLGGCAGPGGDESMVALYGMPVVDDDNDGWFEDDCNDADPDVHPCATETDGDGVDSNCDGIDGTDPNSGQSC
ncbi:MAG: putative metal-binding motif-containing protein [Proteobacteria bacterium]|nr:putative metal-binding motif-containing protein [Pseudomonadota bacterium]